MDTNFSNYDRAEVLTQALPYIKRYTGKTVVVKYGGNAMVNENLKSQVMEDIVLLWLIGIKVVLVHGGGPEITELMDKLGKKPVFVDGLRVTDRETMDIVQMVLAGKVNKTLVNLLEMKGGKAMGISGMDGRLIEAKAKDERLGYVGEITRINIQSVTDLLEMGYIPVISTVCCAAAVSIIKRIDDELLSDVREKSKFIFDSFDGAKGVEAVSGMGPMVGIKPVKPAAEIVKICMENGVLCLTAKDKVRLLPALNISWEVLKKAVEIIKSVCEEQV